MADVLRRPAAAEAVPPAMRTVGDTDELHAAVATWRQAGERIAFVPTMGALHEGHLELVRHSRELAERTVVSVFVNPTQFGPGEDFARYPRDPEGDAALLAGAGADLLFLPQVTTVYPQGAVTRVRLGGPPAAGLEAAHRPGHFEGVATVVTILLELVRPDLAVFGEKDAQQLAVVRRLVRDLHLAVEIVPHPTVREPDGLAMSSRNAYLSAEERSAATVLHRALAAARESIERGEREAAAIRRRMREVLDAEPLARVDYAEVVDAETFEPVERIRGRVVLPLAVHIGKTRLIDTIHLTVDA